MVLKFLCALLRVLVLYENLHLMILVLEIMNKFCTRNGSSPNTWHLLHSREIQTFSLFPFRVLLHNVLVIHISCPCGEFSNHDTNLHKTFSALNLIIVFTKPCNNVTFSVSSLNEILFLHVPLTHNY